MAALIQKLRTLASFVFPTSRLALFCCLMFALELSLLWSSPATPFEVGGPVSWVSIAWLGWFWLTISWVIYVGGQLLKRLKQTAYWSRWLIAAGVGLLSSLLIFMHVGSWGLFRQAGQFANLEAFRFLLVNPPLSIWHDLAVAERIALATVGVVVAMAFFLSEPFIQFLSSNPRTETETVSRGFYCRSTWQCITILLLIPTWIIVSDQSAIRRSTWIQTVKSRVHPVPTIAISTLEQFFREPIPADLETSNLTPLTVKWSPPAQVAKRPSILILAIESLRADTVHLSHQGREILPNINALARRGTQFTNAYAQSTHSDYADVCIVSSLYPLRTREHHYYTSADPWPKTLAFDVFKEIGYSTAIISSQNEGWGNMDQFLETPNLDLFYDAQRSGRKTAEIIRDPGMAHEIKIGALSAGKLEDSHTMDRALDWVTEQLDKEQPFFLSMNFQSSHFPYEVPADFDKPFQPCKLDADVSFMMYPKEKTPQVRNAFYNGIHYCDMQVGRIISKLEKEGVLDDMIVIVLGENGEAFHENGRCGHAQEPVQPMIHVATVVHAPKYFSPGVESYPLEHIDLLPTLLGALELPPHPNFQGIDTLSKNRIPAEERLLFFHVNNVSHQAEAVILGGRWKLMMDRSKHETTLYDLQNDPTESKDLSAIHQELTSQLLTTLQAWRSNQLSYYHHPAYYTKYFPPPAPSGKEIQTP